MYQNYSDTELIEAYSSMMDYSGEPTPDILSEIEHRGGIENFKKLIERMKINSIERARITEEVYSLSSPETDLEFIKKLIKSDILQKEELEKLIESKFLAHQAMLKNKTISSKTIILSFAGAIAGCIVGATVLITLLIFFTPMLLLGYIVLVYIINYLIIKFITKQTRSNIVIFIITLLATIVSVIVGLNIFASFLPAN